MLDDTLLESFATTFYGFGSYRAPYWFVGMEEGGGASPDSVARKLAAWQHRGQQELEDPRAGSTDLSTSPWFRSNPRLQSTWKQLIRIALVAQGHAPSNTDLKAYQRDCLGRADAGICLLELLPLPSPSTKHWFYGEHTSLSYLKTRPEYMERLAPARAAHLKERVKQHIPQAVIFYSFNPWYRHWWQHIAGAPFQRIELTHGAILRAATPGTTFIVTRHPVTMGITNRYFDDVGDMLRAERC